MKDKLKKALEDHRKVIRASSVSMKNRTKSECNLQRLYSAAKLENIEIRALLDEINLVLSANKSLWF